MIIIQLELLSTYIPAQKQFLSVHLLVCFHLNFRKMAKNQNIQPAELEMSLLKLWTKQQVSESYQNIFLNFLDQLTAQQKTDQIQKEIQKTYQHTSMFFLLRENIQLRENLLEDIKAKLSESQNLQIKHCKKQIESVCSSLATLRKMNIIMGENLLKIFQNFRLAVTPQAQQIAPDYFQLFIKMDQDNNFIKDSMMKNFIMFQHGYDPFFLAHYQLNKKKGKILTEKVQCVEKLFDMKISYVYRLMRCQDKMMKYLIYSEGNKDQNINDSEYINYRQSLQKSKNSRENHQRGRSLHLPQISARFLPTVTAVKERNSQSEASTIKPFRPLFRDKRMSLEEGMKRKIASNDSARQKSHMPGRNRPLSPINNASQFRQASSKQLQQLSGYKSQKLPKISISSPNNDNRNFLSKKFNFDTDDQNENAHRRKSKKDNFDNANSYLFESGCQDESDMCLESSSKVESRKSNGSKQRVWNKKHQEQHKIKNRRLQNFIQNGSTQLQQAMQTDHPSTIYPKRSQTNNSVTSYESSNIKDIYDQLPQNRESAMKKPINAKANSTLAEVHPHSHPANQQCLSDQKQIKQAKVKIADSNIPDQQSKPSGNSVKAKQRISSQDSEPVKKDRFQTEPVETYRHSKAIEKEQQKKKEKIKQQKTNPKANLNSNSNNEKQRDPSILSQAQKDQPKYASVNNPQVKMIPGRLAFNGLNKYISEIKIAESHKQQQKVTEQLLKLLNSNQAYLSQFYLNGKKAVVAICCPSTSKSLIICMWAPISGACNQKMSNFFFGKYLVYLEKQTTSKNIVFKGTAIPQLQAHQFQKEKDNYYVRKRKVAVSRESFEFEYFFSMEISNIAFLQTNSESLFYSDEIAPFTKTNSWLNPIFFQTRKEEILPVQLEKTWHQNRQVETIHQVNSILEKDSYDTFEVNEENISSVSNIALTRSMTYSAPKLGFTANQGYMTVMGKVLSQIPNSDSNIYKLQLQKSTNMYFGSGIQSVEQMSIMIRRFKSKSKKQKQSKFSFKMFSKQFYGRYHNSEKLNVGVYGNWDINFAWRDEIPGKIAHNPLQESQIQFGLKSFFIIIQMNDTLLFGVEITDDDFLY